MKTIEEKNRMIAEFMGATLTDILLIKPMYYPLFGETVYLHKMKFHTSWDWLMPCLSKMTTIQGFQDYYYRASEFWEVYNQFDKERCYNELVQFIEWYNEDK